MEETKSKYELYLDKYCEVHHISREEAEQHAVVKEVKQKYIEEGETK